MLRTTNLLVDGKYVALAPGGKVTPLDSRNVRASCRLMRGPDPVPVRSTVPPPPLPVAETAPWFRAPALLLLLLCVEMNVGGTRKSSVIICSMFSLNGTIDTA